MIRYRESIAYNQDLITGRRTELYKTKPVFPVRGIATIELFDAVSGKKQYEAQTENMINDLIGKYAYMDYFYNKIKGSAGQSYYTAPFQDIILTDYSGAEDSSLSYFRGTLTGWADKASAYAGTDNFRGTVNLSETKLDSDGLGTLHYVFDFPTNSANGTFQSIWWAGALSANLTEQGTFTITAPCTRIDATGSIPYELLRTKNYWVLYCGYFATTSGTSPSIAYAKYALVFSDNWTFVKKIDVDAKLPTGFNNSCGYGTTDDSIVVVNGYNTTNNVCIINIDTLVTTIASLNTVTQYCSICARGSRWFLLAGNLKEYTLNGTTFTLVKDYGSNTGQPYTFTDFLSGAFGVRNSSSQLLLVKPDQSMGISALCFSDALSIGAKFPYSGPYDIAYMFKSFTQDGTNVIATISKYGAVGFIGAQTLLSSPVTKTPTNTMKVQYDFQIQKIL